MGLRSVAHRHCEGMRNFDQLLSAALQQGRIRDALTLATTSTAKVPPSVLADAVGNVPLDGLISVTRALRVDLGSLITPDSDDGFIETLIASVDNPTSNFVNRVAKFTTKPSAAITELVLRKGGKVALTEFILRNPGLPMGDQLVAQKLLCEKHARLMYVPRADSWAASGRPDRPSAYRQYLEQSLQLVETSPIDTSDGYFQQAVTSLVADAFFAGYTMPEMLKPYCSGPVLGAASAQAIATQDWDTVSIHSRPVAMLEFNRGFLDKVTHLPPEDQASVARAFPLWSVIDRVDDPSQVLGSGDDLLGSAEFRITQAIPQSHYPSYRVVRALSVRHINSCSRQGNVFPVFMRLLDETLGDNRDLWTTFEALYDEWELTLGELLDVVCGVH